MSTSVSWVTDRMGGDSEGFMLALLEYMIWPILALVVIGILLTVPQTFRNVSAVQLALWGSVPLGLLVLGESACLLSGHFDLSIGSIMGFSAMFTGLLFGQWGVISNPVVGFVVILAVGGIIGLVNGVFISKFNVNPFLQTLAFLIIFQGAKTALSTQPVSVPSAYLIPGGSPNIAIAILLATFILIGIVMRYSQFGQAVYAVGSNEESARAVGVSTDTIIMAVYTISGVLAGLAGLMSTGFTGVVPPLIGEGQVFPAFAAAVIGGVSLFGGRGKISGALGGVVLLGIIQSALSVSGVPATEVQIVNGIVLLAAILLYNTQERIRNRILAAGA